MNEWRNEMKRIAYCYVDGQGQEQYQHVTDEKGGAVGYSIDEHTARIWKSIREESETKIIPLSRVVFIRQITKVI